MRFPIISKNKYLFGFKLYKNIDFIEIGGGYGHLSRKLLSNGINLVLFVEPEKEKYKKSKLTLNHQISCQNKLISEIDLKVIKRESKYVCVLMQDVIEHIPINDQKKFFQELRLIYDEITFIGRTPNLKSIFGLRNSFGDNTHIYRFTNHSLRDFLLNLGFSNIDICKEPYQITGLVSLVRLIPYHIILVILSLSFLFIYGSWEGFMTPNIVFKAKFKK